MSRGTRKPLVGLYTPVPIMHAKPYGSLEFTAPLTPTALCERTGRFGSPVYGHLRYRLSRAASHMTTSCTQM